MSYILPGKGAYDRSRAEPPEYPEDRDETAEHVPLDCESMGRQYHHSGAFHIRLHMTDQQKRHAVLTLMECLPADLRASLIEELQEVT